MGDVQHIGPVAAGVGIKLPDTFLTTAAVCGLDIPSLVKEPKSFSFHRERRDGVWGWQTHLHVGCLTIWRGWAKDMPFPRRRAEAEAWACDFAARHGFQAMVRVRERRAKERPKLTLLRGGAAPREGAP